MQAVAAIPKVAREVLHLKSPTILHFGRHVAHHPISIRGVCRPADPLLRTGDADPIRGTIKYLGGISVILLRLACRRRHIGKRAIRAGHAAHLPRHIAAQPGLASPRPLRLHKHAHGKYKLLRQKQKDDRCGSHLNQARHAQCIGRKTKNRKRKYNQERRKEKQSSVLVEQPR